MKYQTVIKGKTYTVIRHLSVDGGKTYKLWDQCTDEEIAHFREYAAKAIGEAVSNAIYLNPALAYRMAGLEVPECYRKNEESKRNE